jgi:predicted naringenin-chalcone synthase
MSYRSCYLQGIGTAVPSYQLAQSDFLERLLRRAYSPNEQRYLKHILHDCSIKQRHLVLELDHNGAIFYKGKHFEDQSTKSRNQVFMAEVSTMAELATQECLSITKIPADKITHLITVTCTGFSNPGFDIDLIESIGLSKNVHRLSVGFMGCYAALPALEMARTIVCAEKDAQVLVVCAEICSIHFHPHGGKDSMLAATLFSDGVSVAHLSADDNTSHLKVSESFSRLVPGSISQMAWMIGDQGFDIRLSPYVSKIIGANLDSILPGSWLASIPGRTNWAVHPGGKSILDKVEAGLNLSPNELDESRLILSEYGNMSSATILFVLQRLLKNRCFDPEDIIHLLAFGPGLTVVGCQLVFNQ